MRFTRDFYIPSDANELADPKSDAVAYIYQNKNGALFALGFCGKRQKPDFHFRYENATRLQTKVVNYFISRRSSLIIKAMSRAENAAKRAKGHDYNVGDILYSSWGYEQTNVDFYQVVKLNGKTMLTLRKIGQTEFECDGHMQGKTSAVKDSFIGDEFRVRVNAYGSVKISDCQSGSKWDGRPKSWSSYH